MTNGESVGFSLPNLDVFVQAVTIFTVIKFGVLVVHDSVCLLTCLNSFTYKHVCLEVELAIE